MADNQEILNDGEPAFPDPVALTDEAKRFGNALVGAWGTEANPSSFGEFLRRLTQDATVALGGGQTVIAIGVPMVIIAVTATSGGFTGPLAERISGLPGSGEVLVAYAANGSVTLTINAGDGITGLDFRGLAVPGDLITHLDAESNPPP